MGKPYSDDLRERVVASIEAGHSRVKVAELYNMALSTVGGFIKRKRDSLSRVQQKAIYNRLKSLKSDPCPADSKALEDYAPLMRIKKANVRAIYDPEPPDASGRIFISRIGVSHSIYDFEELSQYQSDK